MKFTIETITPDRAKAILEDCNAANYRKMSDKTVRRYALDMAHRNWRETGEAIKFTTDGQLADGQQRLAACVMANESFTTAVIRGVESEAVEVMDFGRKRSLDALLARRGEASAMRLASAIGLGWRWETDQLLSSAALSPPEALEWLRRNPEIRDAVRITNSMVSELKIPPSSISVFCYRAQQIDPAEEVQFRQALRSGAGLEQRHPVLVLRHYLLNGVGADRRYRPDSVGFLALFIKAWNFTLQGRNIRTIGWRREGVNREPFPIMLAKPEAARA